MYAAGKPAHTPAHDHKASRAIMESQGILRLGGYLSPICPSLLLHSPYLLHTHELEFGALPPLSCATFFKANEKLFIVDSQHIDYGQEKPDS